MSAKAYSVFSELCQFDLIDWHITAAAISMCHRCCRLRPRTVYLFHDVSSAYNTGLKRTKVTKHIQTCQSLTSTVVNVNVLAFINMHCRNLLHVGEMLINREDDSELSVWRR